MTERRDLRARTEGRAAVVLAAYRDHSAYDLTLVGPQRAVDGDTVDGRYETAWMDLADHMEVKARRPKRWRLVVVDTPERGQPRWAEARDQVQAWLTAREGRLRVRTLNDDSLGRGIGDVYEQETGETLTGYLLGLGYAVWKGRQR